ncbi:MAG TPA: Hsp20/alpha crystallin family protein [Acidobacteriota bacterium]|nr:Hsp20/alpha crystallin family protein [Acidobacteriota bacterium]
MLTLRPYQDFPRSRVWDRFFNDSIFRVLDGLEGTERETSSHSWTPAVDIYETPDEFVFDAELPGFERDHIDINVEEGTLSITAERKAEESDQHNYQRRERLYGKFYRSFRLPVLANAEKITASLKDGVLTVRVPKREEARPRQIKVEG